MKFEEIARPGLIAIGVVGIAASALLGFAAGATVSRDPQALRNVMRRVAHGIERATLAAAQAREQIGDLWAEVREEAIAEVDAADFERAAANAAKKEPTAPVQASPKRAPRKPAASPRKARKAATLVSRSRPTSAKESV